MGLTERRADRKADRKKEKKSPIIKILMILTTLALICVAGFNFYMVRGGEALSPNDTTPVIVTIPEGSGTGKIAGILLENHLISNETVFKLQSRFKGNDGKYKVGSYVLSPSMTMDEMMNIIIEGKQQTKRFTIPEGYDIKRTAQKLSSEGFVDQDKFLEEIEYGTFDYGFLKDAPQGPNRLEGYLYPETYDVYESATEADIINRMLQQFDKLFTQEYYDRANELGMTINQVLTIASLIERETRVKDEKAIVSSVIKNRIDLGMPLQIDATIQYALGEQKERLLYADLEIDSPYNTYKIKGLPPGPICSPGIDSIYAALHPAETDYLYYVLNPSLNGTHSFTNNYNQFLKDKQNYINNAFSNQ